MLNMHELCAGACRVHLTTYMPFRIGGTCSHSCTHPAVGTKLMMLLAPYLKRWNYTRQPEQVCSPSAWLLLV